MRIDGTKDTQRFAAEGMVRKRGSRRRTSRFEKTRFRTRHRDSDTIRIARIETDVIGSSRGQAKSIGADGGRSVSSFNHGQRFRFSLRDGPRGTRNRRPRTSGRSRRLKTPFSFRTVRQDATGKVGGGGCDVANSVAADAGNRLIGGSSVGTYCLLSLSFCGCSLFVTNLDAEVIGGFGGKTGQFSLWVGEIFGGGNSANCTGRKKRPRERIGWFGAVFKVVFGRGAISLDLSPTYDRGVTRNTCWAKKPGGVAVWI